MFQKLTAAYHRLVLDQPAVALGIIAVLIGGLSVFIGDFKLDASGDALVLETDKDYRYYQSISAKYASDEFLVVTYSPHGDLFSTTTIESMKQLRDELKQLPRVGSVVTYLDVPLVNSPKVTFAEIVKQARTLETPDTNLEMARTEFTQSPLYKNLLVSTDGKTTAIQINFLREQRYKDLSKTRNELREKRLSSTLTVEEQNKLDEVGIEFKQYTTLMQEQESQDIKSIRSILDKYRNNAEIHLGGLPMIVSDMIDYIAHDIEVFGIGVVLFIIALLSFSFRRPRWVILPVIICLSAVIGMVGYLGLVDWRVTVVSSNFISLLLIISLSLTVHLLVRYQELHAEKPDGNQRDFIVETLRSKIVPSFYTVTTTMVAFGSLLVSGIRPVIDFGWMMVFGVGLAFVIAFVLFPSGLMLLKPGKPVMQKSDSTGAITGFLANLIHKNSNATLFFFAAVVVFTAIGISNISVENRFIDYFKSSTEIYQGMIKIDQELGGTTPLEVIIDADSQFIKDLKLGTELALAQAAADADEDDFEDEETNAGLSGTSYWFNVFKLSKVNQIHQYLDELPETGKVLSLATSMEILTQLNDGEEMTNIILSVLYRRLPPDVKNTLFVPYMSADGNQIRFTIRVFESDYNLRRQVLIDQIKKDLVEKFDLEKDQVNVTGMVVLYNNMLQSLYTSQILTIGVVFLAIMIMFLVLFRSFKISLIAIIPNMVAAGLVLGMMGWLGIPLDIMTITIAAITIGIAVDNSIHYVHRFQTEHGIDKNYWAAVKRTHKSTGRAMYYTSMTVTLGFSILALSNFIPTIYFGLFTGMAMMVALLANLTLLPTLLVKFKAVG